MDLKALDFVFNGSTLEMLASKEAPVTYVATRVPGTQCILVQKDNAYTFCRGHYTNQFKRYVRGHDMSDTSSCNSAMHMHLCKVGENSVLFSAMVDAIDADGMPVKARTYHPRYIGTAAMLQMISTGSTSLCHGETSRNLLNRVVIKSLSHVTKEAFAYSSCNVEQVERNILDGMESIKNQIEDEGGKMG